MKNKNQLKTISQKLNRIFAWLGIFALFTMMIQAILPGATMAAQITNRSLTLKAGTDPGSMPGGVVKHEFAYTVPGSNSVGSIKFQYCTLAAGTCTMPTGLVTTSATLDFESGITGFTINNATNGSPYLTRTAAAVGSNVATVHRLGSITNPTTTNTTFYVRITTYNSTDTTGAVLDSGVVAASTATQIVLTGTMPESLVFCTGGTVGTTSSVPDCATATSGSVSFDRLFSPIDTATATSQMAASTNATTGYAITVNGTTLTSGANTITAMSSSTGIIRGSGQFGLNLKANTLASSTPAVGLEVAPASNGTNYRGEAFGGYASVDNFKFVTGDTVADSGNATLGGTDAQIFTISYIVNVPGSQPAGTYTTTLTYICTPTF